jgi:hypothetical protein
VSKAGRTPRLFKRLAALTFATGALIDTGRVLVGREQWVREYFTPPVDIAFGILVLSAAIPGLLSWHRYSGGRAGRIVCGFAMLMLLVSVPLHLRTIKTWSTDYLIVFPVWYSLIEIPLFVFLSLAMTRLQFDRRKFK